MRDFDSLTLVLENWFDTPMCDLPDALRQRVEKEFSLMPWDRLTADQRRSGALQQDYKHDPITEQDRQFWWDFFERKNALEKQITRWQTTTTPAADGRALNETSLAALQQEFARMERYERKARYNYYPERQRVDGEGVESSSTLESCAQYVAYPKAIKLLIERLDATQEELAAWVWMGPKDGGIAAYLHANELDSPPRFYYDYFMGENYIGPLMGCWFQSSDLANFQPTDRYITGKVLIERWTEQPSIQVKGFIVAKIKESRLVDFHPTCGGTEPTPSGIGEIPTLETCLFALSQVEEIELSDFGSDETESPVHTKFPGDLNHDQQMQQRANEIAVKLTISGSGRKPTKERVAQKLAAELDQSFEVVLRRIRKLW